MPRHQNSASESEPMRWGVQAVNSKVNLAGSELISDFIHLALTAQLAGHTAGIIVRALVLFEIHRRLRLRPFESALPVLDVFID